MTALNMVGASSPMSRSCHGWDAAYLPLLILGAVARTFTSVSMATAELRGRFMYVGSARAWSASQVQSCDSQLTWHSRRRMLSARASCSGVEAFMYERRRELAGIAKEGQSFLPQLSAFLIAGLILHEIADRSKRGVLRRAVRAQFVEALQAKLSVQASLAAAPSQ